LPWTRIPSRGGVEMCLVVSCYRNRDKLRPDADVWYNYRCLFLLTGENKDWEESMNSHMFFTVHIYQYRVEKNSKNAGGGIKRQFFSQLGDSLNLDMLILLTDFLIIFFKLVTRIWRCIKTMSSF